MLADEDVTIASGALDADVLPPCFAKVDLVGFIASQIGRWRDDPERPTASSETKLTEYLCNFLNSAAYRSKAWNHIQFQTEISDEVVGSRKIDLGAKPLASVLLVEGRRHTQFDLLFPIECKRLPTPPDPGRDHREYVITSKGVKGGIQRFKLAKHGASHQYAAMLGYLQQDCCSDWLRTINDWISKLSPPWTKSDSLSLVVADLHQRTAIMHSQHTRPDPFNKITIDHIWVEMN